MRTKYRAITKYTFRKKDLVEKMTFYDFSIVNYA